MTEMMYAEPFAWRAVGITTAALAAYAEAGHRPIKGVERAHLIDRAQMIAHIFDRDEPLGEGELFDYWRENDRVVIALRQENRASTLGSWIPFENPEAQYFTRLGIGFLYRPAVEGALTLRLASICPVMACTRLCATSLASFPQMHCRQGLEKSVTEVHPRERRLSKDTKFSSIESRSCWTHVSQSFIQVAFTKRLSRL